MQWCWCSDGASHAVSLDGGGSLKTKDSSAGISLQKSSSSGLTDSPGQPSDVCPATPELGPNNKGKHRQIDGNASEPSASVSTISKPQQTSLPNPNGSSPKQQPTTPTQAQHQQPAKTSTASLPILSLQPLHPLPKDPPPSSSPNKPSPPPSSAPSRSPNPSPGTTLPPPSHHQHPEAHHHHPPPHPPPHHYPPTRPAMSSASSRPTSIRNIAPGKKAELDRVEWQAVDAAIRKRRECPGLWTRVWGCVGRVFGCGCGGRMGEKKEKGKKE